MPFRKRWVCAAAIACAWAATWCLEACSLEPTPPRTVDCVGEDRAAERYPDTCGDLDAGSDAGDGSSPTSDA